MNRPGIEAEVVCLRPRLTGKLEERGVGGGERLRRRRGDREGGGGEVEWRCQKAENGRTFVPVLEFRFGHLPFVSW